MILKYSNVFEITWNLINMKTVAYWTWEEYELESSRSQGYAATAVVGTIVYTCQARFLGTKLFMYFISGACLSWIS